MIKQKVILDRAERQELATQLRSALAVLIRCEEGDIMETDFQENSQRIQKVLGHIWDLKDESIISEDQV